MTEEMEVFESHGIKQDQAIFSDKKITVLGTGIQFGKGLTLNTGVLTPNGYIHAALIKVGDTVFDRNGVPTKVVGVFPQGPQQTYKITFSHGETITTDGSHLNILIPRPGRPERIESTEDLFKKKFLWGKAQIPSAKPIVLPKKKFLLSPYVMGVLLGDGCIVHNAGFSSADKEIIGRLRSELPDGMDVRHKSNYDFTINEAEPKRTKEGYGFNRVCAELRRLGLLGLKSHEKFVPKEYLFASIPQRLDLLRGLLDTDGCIINKPNTKVGRCIQYYSTSRDLANSAVWLVESLGGKAWVLEKKTARKLCYIVNVILKDFNPFWLPRKADKHFAHKNTTNKIISKVEKLGVEETVCFSVESKTKSFIIENQVVTHNTLSGAYWLKRLIHENPHPDSNFLVVAPTYKILEQSTLPPFLKIMEGYGTYNSSRATFKVHGGGTVYFRTNTDPDSIVGITNVKAIWGDEAGKFTLYFWENIQARASFCDCPVMLTTSPYTINWIWKDLIKPYREGKISKNELLVIQAASVENPYFPKDVYERKKQTMDPRRFKMLYGGEWGRMAGLVYDCFSDKNIISRESMQLPTDVTYYAGIDWGYTEPFCLTIRAVTKYGYHYQIFEHYKSGLTIPRIVELCKQQKIALGVKMFFCGPDRPENIEELNRNGVPAVAADNKIRIGIDRHYELIKTGRFRILEGSSPYSLDEYDTYHYPEPEDLGPDDKAKEQLPVAANDHALDSARYCTASLWHLHREKIGREIEENEERQTVKRRFEKLRIKKGGNRQTEDWS